ncbi:MAG TPA: type IV pilus twitching motility protein PilT [candidate division WOR-3 bacterium]|uniref:Type IV pilus twitching motility protein PilT n=1 Tax=candidate division WOR-3 bacterium TaxID=2052148 RepID=A0A9C9EL39_UNCW3|nr:type IV pilus twitching motility protein PilT [candidate division WOR-3 bacterium]
MPVTMKQLLEEMVQRNSTDLHLTTGAPPMYRIDGELVPTNYEIMTPELIQNLVYSVLNDQQKKRFEMEWELDFSFGIAGLSRFRGNCFQQRGSVAAAIRTIPFEIRGFKELGIPMVVQELAGRPKGLILCTGPTGSGKSTTLAAIIDKVNSERRCHIVTVEDPIEYLFRHKKAIINQRQVGSDTKSFANALKYVLREDPDVVMVGEMRDPETIGTTLTIAETGHLTLATLHTNSAAESIHRIIDVFPPHQQGQVRAQLAFVVEGVITQQLLPKIGGGRVLAAEVMIATPAIRALIRDEKEHQIYSTIQAGAKYGMQTMNQSLYTLYSKRLITLETAFDYTPNIEEFEHMVEQKSPVLK